MKGRKGRATASVRRSRESFGRVAEYVAMVWLWCKGYRLVEHRLRTVLGEIDLVMRRGGHFAFVEVKGRRSWREEESLVSGSQLSRVSGAAGMWLSREEAGGRLPEAWSASVDVVLVRPWRLPFHIANVMG